VSASRCTQLRDTLAQKLITNSKSKLQIEVVSLDASMAKYSERAERLKRPLFHHQARQNAKVAIYRVIIHNKGIQNSDRLQTRHQ
jgi:hypothetical protein